MPVRAGGLGVSWTRAASSRGERGPTPGNLARAVPLWTGHGRDDGWDLWNDASLEASKGLSDLEQKPRPVVWPSPSQFSPATRARVRCARSKHSSEALLPALSTTASRGDVWCEQLTVFHRRS